MTPPLSIPRRASRRGLVLYAGLIAGGAMVLSACGHSAPTRFFTLDATASAVPAVAGYAGPPVKVLAVHIPPALDRTELVTETAPGRMEVHDFEHWEAPLGLTARQTLAQDLAGRLPAGAVTGPDAPGGPNLAALTAEVIAFQTGPDGARMQASWSVTLPASAGGASQAVWRAPILQLQAPQGAPDGDGIATAFSALLGQLADRIAADLPGASAILAAQQRQQEAALRPPAQTRTTRKTTTQVQRRF